MSKEKDQSNPVDRARAYYNSEDADTFYHTVWGGEDLHIGIYESDDDTIFDASRRTVERIAGKIRNPGKEMRVLDLGAGYGGSMRYLARHYGCRAVALNLSEVENERNRRMNKEQGLEELIEVVDGSFEKLDFKDNTFNVVWSQDSFLHSAEREHVLTEAARVLKPGGDFVFTDPMKADDCPEEVLQPILDRLQLEDLGSPAFYRSAGETHGLRLLEFEELQDQLPRHYARVLEELEQREEELRKKISADYLDRMKTGLRHWVEGGRKGRLTWGIFHFSK
jgi:sarcosine/dimethylglycine N-methyltransferase